MRKKQLSIILVLIMVVTMLPITTEKASATPYYDPSIGEYEYTTLQDASNAVTVTGSAITLLENITEEITSQLSFDSNTESQDCTNTSMHTQHNHATDTKCWAWDKNTATLTLDGINLEVSREESAINLSLESAKLVLKGDNTVTLKDSLESFVKTIYARNLEISGTGYLTVNGCNRSDGRSRTVSSGFYTAGLLKITDGTIVASGGAVSTTGTEYYVGSESNGIWAYGGFEITGGTVNATGGSVVYENYGYSYGISAGTGSIRLSGGTVTAKAMSGRGHRPFLKNPVLTGVVLRAGTGAWDNTTGEASTYEPAPFVAVSDITMTNADSVEVNTDLTLAGTVAPDNTTNQTIVWSVQSANGTGATVTGNTFHATAVGTATIKAAVTNGSGVSSDYTKNFTITVSPNTPPTPPFVAVDNITMTNADSVEVNTDLTLVGTVTPGNATNQTIVWSVKSANGTGATITGNTFRATAVGTATIKAAVTNGSGVSSDYTKNFTITVSPNTPPTPPFVAVNDITMTNADSVEVNTDLTLAGTVAPDNATNQTIVWSVQSANGTGATITGNTLYATKAGTVAIRATVASGSSISSEYSKNFIITVKAYPDSYHNYTPVKEEGKFEKEQRQGINAPTANLKDSKEDLKAKVLSTTEQVQVAAGSDAKVILKVQDISASVSDEDKKRIEEKLVAEQQNIANSVLLYVDISLYKQVGNGQETRVTETSGKIKISIEVPESMWSTEAGADRTYRVVRIHDGVTELLEGNYDPTTHLFTFETDRFSTYVLTYQDGNTISDKNSGGTSDQLAAVQDFNHLRLTAKAYKTSQKLSYVKVSDADGYFIYGAKCGQKMKMLAEVEGIVNEYTVNKLKQATYYKYQVKAYKLIDGEKVIFMTSKVIHSVTEGKTYGNPTKVTSGVTSVKLAVGEFKTLTCQVVLPKGKKQKEHTAVIRYESTNKEITTVSSKGKITAKAKGTCYIYAYTQNGVYKKIKVVVG